MNDSSIIAITIFFLLVILAIGFVNIGTPETAVSITLIVCLTIAFLAMCAMLAYAHFMDNSRHVQEARQLVLQTSDQIEEAKKALRKEMEEKTKEPPPLPSTPLDKIITLAKDTKTTVRTEEGRKGAAVVTREEINPLLAELIRDQLNVLSDSSKTP